MPKPDPKELLRQKYAEFKDVQQAASREMERRRLVLSTIIELQGWTIEEANEILGEKVFQEPQEK